MRLSAALTTAFVAILALPAAASAQPGGGRLFVSPAGQVFRPSETAPRPFAAWFQQADANHDGAISQAEFNADFDRAFRAFDTNGDGEIDPDEVFTYETRVFPEMSGAGFGGRRGGGAPSSAGTATASRYGGPTRRGRAGGGPRMVGGAARFGMLPIYHPIMDADANMNRGISRGEWAAAAARRFAMLDPNHTGSLTAPGMVERRMEERPGGRRGRRGRPPQPPVQPVPAAEAPSAN